METPPAKLRKLLTEPGILIMPCCYDALSARLVESAGFKLTFMSGFAVSAAKLGLPDTGLISYGEMIEQGRDICAAVSIPVFGDGDTGYGNAINVKRTVRGYARTGFAGIMIEDQSSPKRCGHTRGKQVVDFNEAVLRIRAAVAARNECADIVIMARTDARATHGLEEAIRRANAFVDCGADVVFVEAPQSEQEMRYFCDSVPGPKLANMLEQGQTPILSPTRLEEIGFKIAAYPLTLLSASIRAMQESLAALKEGRHPEQLLPFARLKDIIGFNAYFAEEERYAIK